MTGAATLTPVVFTDLDGTLLDHETYSFEAALPGLDALKAARIPLVLASSKTRAEMRELAPQVGACGLIFENGGGVDWPAGLQPPTPGEDTVSHAQLRAFLDDLPVGLRSQVRGFSDMSDKDVADLTGLSLASAALARQREHSEPFVFTGTEDELQQIASAAAQHGWRLVRGGRFNTLTGPHTKATRLNQMRDAWATQGHAVHAIGLGDAPNDADMLEACERGFIIANPHGAPVPALAGEKHGRISRSATTGPAGWSESVLSALNELEQK